MAAKSSGSNLKLVDITELSEYKPESRGENIWSLEAMGSFLSQMPSACPLNENLPSVQPVPLPAEIYECIIDELFDSPETLLSCALVCHLFARRAQKHLFARVDFTRPLRTSKHKLGKYLWPTAQFLHLITVSPHLAPLVKHVHISDELQLKPYREERSWIRKDTSLRLVLSDLEELDSFSIAGNKGSAWLKFGEWCWGLRSEILGICQCPKLTRLSFSCVKDLPLSLLDRAPNLVELVLSNVLVVPDCYTLQQVRVYQGLYQQQQAKGVQDNASVFRDAELALWGRRRARLRAFNITATSCEEWRAFHQSLRYLHLDLSYIRTLDLHIIYTPLSANGLPSVGSGWEDPERQAVVDLVRGCKATLETLRSYIPEDVMSAGRPFIDFSSLRALRTLCLHGYIWTEDHAVAAANNSLPITPLRTLTALVTNSLPPQLEYLTFLLFIQDFEGIENSGLKDAGWAEFVEALERLGTRSRDVGPSEGRGSCGKAAGFTKADARGGLEATAAASANETYSRENEPEGEVPSPGRRPISLSIIYSIKRERGTYVRDLVDGWVGHLRTRGAMVVMLPRGSKHEEGDDSDSDSDEEEEEEEEEEG